MAWNRIILLILTLILLSTANAGTNIDFSLSCRTAKIDTTFDYELAFKYSTTTASLEYEHERENGSLYHNYELNLTKSLLFLHLSAKKLKIESRSVDISQVSLSMGGKALRLGLARLWQSDGNSTEWYGRVKGSAYQLEVLTHDFDTFNYKADLKYRTDLEGKVNYFVSIGVKDYGDPDWSFKTGIEIRL